MDDDEDAYLDLVDEDYRFWIQWFFDGDGGAKLGENTYTQRDLDKATPEDRDHILATITASKTDGVEHDNTRGYYWESKKHATAAFRMVKAALKTDPGAPWPDWALKAKAAGWKPPKGWKP